MPIQLKGLREAEIAITIRGGSDLFNWGAAKGAIQDRAIALLRKAGLRVTPGANQLVQIVVLLDDAGPQTDIVAAYFAIRVSEPATLARDPALQLPDSPVVWEEEYVLAVNRSRIREEVESRALSMAQSLASWLASINGPATPEGIN